MDLLKLFTREESIAGLEISDTYIRFALLSVVQAKKTAKGSSKKESKKGSAESVEVKTVGEIRLAEGVISGGRIKNKEVFIKALKDLIKTAKPQIKYAIVSIPPDSIYSKVYSFPKTITGEKLKEAMRTTVDLQLPINSKEFYSDWQAEEWEDNKPVFLASAPKDISDEYASAVLTAGIRPVAIEFHPLSVARAINIPPGNVVLFLIFYKESILVSILDNGVIGLNRFLPVSFFGDKKLFTDEIARIINFYESDSKKPVSQILTIEPRDRENLSDALSSALSASPAKIAEIFLANQSIKNNENKWLIAGGAAQRGIIPRSKDSLVSLMPVGTQEAYENHKAIAFVEFISTAVIIISVFFVAVFFASWLLMISIGKNFSDHISALNAAPSSGDAGGLEKRAVELNELINNSSSIVKKMPTWSLLLEELKSRVITGININSLSLPGPEGQMVFVGVAQNRNQINLFKKSLDESPLLTDVNLPLTNLAQKENIPFSVVFRLKDPNNLLFHN